MTYEDRPASHAVAHVEDTPCGCHGKTEAEIAAPYALFVFLMAALVLAALVVAVVFG